MAEVKPKIPRASYERGVTRTSKIKEVQNVSVLDEPITLDLDSTKPVSFMDNPDEIVPHDQIPEHVRRSIVETYSEEFFLSKEWSRGQLIRLSRAIKYPDEDINRAMAQICGPNCSVKDLCPYDIAGRPPIGDRCPIELVKSKKLYAAYVDAVSVRLNIDAKDITSNIILHNLINGLVEADMIEDRLNGSISEDGFITLSPSVVNEQTGEVFTKEEESVAVRIKEKVARRKDQLYRQLLATPEMAEKYRRKGPADVVAKSAQLLERMEKMVQDMSVTRRITDGETIP